jgi:hypothetical protein
LKIAPSLGTIAKIRPAQETSRVDRLLFILSHFVLGNEVLLLVRTRKKKSNNNNKMEKKTILIS